MLQSRVRGARCIILPMLAPRTFSWDQNDQSMHRKRRRTSEPQMGGTLPRFRPCMLRRCWPLDHCTGCVPFLCLQEQQVKNSLIPGFVLATRTITFAYFPPPRLPPGYVPLHRPGRPAEAAAAPGASQGRARCAWYAHVQYVNAWPCCAGGSTASHCWDKWEQSPTGVCPITRASHSSVPLWCRSVSRPTPCSSCQDCAAPGHSLHTHLFCPTPPSSSCCQVCATPGRPSCRLGAAPGH